MAILVILAIGLLVPAAAAVLAQRRGLTTRLADIRGVALQTVIVIVVMLVIAGAVAGVLLTRGGDVVDDLEGQSVGPVTPDNCVALEVSDVVGVVYPTTAGATPTHCVWTNATSTADGDKVGRAACTVVGGTFKEADTATISLGGATFGLAATGNSTGCEVTFDS